jgi:hypothetical protein
MNRLKGAFAEAVEPGRGLSAGAATEQAQHCHLGFSLILRWSTISSQGVEVGR